MSCLLHVLLGKGFGPSGSGENRGWERILFLPNFFSMSRTNAGGLIHSLADNRVLLPVVTLSVKKGSTQIF